MLDGLCKRSPSLPKVVTKWLFELSPHHGSQSYKSILLQDLPLCIIYEFLQVLSVWIGSERGTFILTTVCLGVNNEELVNCRSPHSSKLLPFLKKKQLQNTHFFLSLDCKMLAPSAQCPSGQLSVQHCQ